MLLSDLGNSFPLQTVFVSLFCLFCSCWEKKKHLCKAPWLLNLGIRCLGSDFSVGFCEVTLVSERRLFWVRGSHSSYSIGSSLGGLFSLKVILTVDYPLWLVCFSLCCACEVVLKLAVRRCFCFSCESGDSLENHLSFQIWFKVCH